MIKWSLNLIFVLQIYLPVKSLKEEENLGVIYTFLSVLDYALAYFVLIFGNKSSCYQGKLVLF